jgi:hypothetical protein
MVHDHGAKRIEFGIRLRAYGARENKKKRRIAAWGVMVF